MDYYNNQYKNEIIDIDYDYLKKMYDDNIREIYKAEQMTASSYRGESFYSSDDNFLNDFDREILVRDQLTAGMKMQYPHGVVIKQPSLRNYYRGENQIYKKSIPSLLRKLENFNSEKEKALYRIVSDMRIAEFKNLINQFTHVKSWNYGDVLNEILAQHYGVETSWLDITSNFNVAFFFATCYYNQDLKEWRPLDKKRIDENPYGMIFHMPSYQKNSRWLESVDYFTTVSDEVEEVQKDGTVRMKMYKHPIFKGIPQNLIYPIGFQPFMRCAMQYGYGIYMRTSNPLQEDEGFEKLRFKHSEKLSQAVFELMEGGRKIYPHEGLRDAEFIIEQIRNGTVFSENAFRYALYRSQEYSLNDEEKCREDLKNFSINGSGINIVNYSPYKISSGRRKKIDKLYSGFSLEDRYGIRIITRGSPTKMQSMYEPWMLSEKEGQQGVVDYIPKECEPNVANLWTWHAIALLFMVKNADIPEL